MCIYLQFTRHSCLFDFLNCKGALGHSETMAPAYQTTWRQISQTMTSHSTPWEYEISSMFAAFFHAGAVI